MEVLTDSMDLDVVPSIFKVVNGSFDTSKLYPKVDVINLPDVLNGTLKMRIRCKKYHTEVQFIMVKQYFKEVIMILDFTLYETLVTHQKKFNKKQIQRL